MANEHEAQIKLTLDGGQFVGTLRKVGDDTAKLGKQGQRTTTALQRGFDGAKKSAMGLGSVVKKGIGLLGGLGVAFSAGASIKQAVSLNARFETLAFRVQTATGALTKAAEIQDIVSNSAATTTRTSEEMAGAFEEVFGATKDLAFAKGVMESIGVAATATGEEVGTVATIAQQMQRKFGVSAESVSNSLAQIFEGAQQGGPSFQQLSDVIDTVGASLLQAGLKGQRGLDFLIGSLNATDAEFGDLGKQVTGIQNLLINLGQSARLEKIGKALGMSGQSLINEKDALARLRRILSTGKKGLAELKANFIGPEEQKALRVLFTDPFEKALDRAKSAGLRGKEATDQALRSLDGVIEGFGKSTLTAADLQKRAAERQVEPAAKLRAAQEKLTQAFQQPEIVDAIEALAESLPQIAALFADFVKFASKNPVLAGALGIGGVAAKGFLTGIVSSLATGGTSAAGSMLEAMTKGSGVMSKAMLALGGPLGAALAAAVVGALVAKEQIDKGVSEDASTEGKLGIARAHAARRSGSLALNKKDASELEAAIAAKKASQSNLTTQIFQPKEEEIRIRREIEAAESELQDKRDFIRQMERGATAARGAGPAGSAPDGGKVAKVGVDDASARSVGKAVASHMKTETLRVFVVNDSSGRMGAAIGGLGGSRGPTRLASPMPGGAT